LSNANRVLKEIERKANREFLPIIGPHKGQVLLKVIHEIKPKRVLEIGTLVGYSTILMGKELGSDAHLVSIEIDPDEAQIAEENIKRAKIPSIVEILVGDAIDVLPRLEGMFDLVFIDAEKSDYLNYLKLIENRLHKGSVVAVDNVGFFASQMRKYLEYVRSSGKYDSRYVPANGDGIEISAKL
jgi:predicted O-methyltransferase YrrM